MPQSSVFWIILAIVVIVILAVLAWSYSRRQRTAQLRRRFGPEYDRAVQQYGSQSRAEAALEAREAQAKQLHLHPIAPDDRARFAQSWRSIEARFVDDPAGAVADAARLLDEVMRAHGYPDASFDQRLSDLSATYPNLTDDYRTAHEIGIRGERHEASTEDLRRAMVAYRSLFDELLGMRERERKEAA